MSVFSIGFRRHVLLTAMVALASACSTIVTQGLDQGQKPLVEGNGLEANGIGSNGFVINGINLQGQGQNGILLNGIGTNGIGTNGMSINSIGLNGLYFNGIGTNGIGTNGIGTNGIGTNGIGTNGIGTNGIGTNGIGTNGIGTNGIGTNGLDLNGWAINGLYLNGIGTNGIGTNGIGTNGIGVDGGGDTGQYINGLGTRGVGLTAVGLDGLKVNGTGTGAVLIGDGNGDAVPLTAQQEAEFELVMEHVVGCALADGDSLTIHRSDGTGKVYSGLRGFAGEWKTGPVSQTGAESVRACMTDVAVQHYMALNAQQEANLHKLLTYLVQCALPSGDSLTIYASDGTARQYDGALGLAPEWKDSAPTPVGQRRVSACLVARVNAFEKPVQISLRGTSVAGGAGLSVTALEQIQYRHREGAFWADLFTAQPYIKTCADQGATPVRVCTASNQCGFDYQGTCASVCSASDPSVGHYLDCGGDSEVLTAFLRYSSRISFGANVTCFQGGDDSVSCWGHNSYGQVGDGTTADVTTPVTVLTDVRHMAPGIQHSSSLLRDGSVWAWGRNDSFQLGTEAAPDSCNGTPCSMGPQAVASLGTDTVQLASGDEFTCALQADGTVLCWGKGSRGRLGNGSLDNQSSPTPVSNLNGVAQLATGTINKHMCALRNDGTVWCWGQNSYGQMGNGTVSAKKKKPVQTDVQDAVSVCVGGAYACAVESDGAVSCWGRNDLHQLGDGGSAHSPVPVSVALPASPGAKAVDCGKYGACALLEDHTVWCWGENQAGQLSDGTTVDRSVPVQAMDSSGGPVTGESLYLGTRYACVSRADGTVRCWGKNDLRQLGDGTTTDRHNAVRMTYHPCGNGTCEVGLGETNLTCSADCTEP